MERKAFLAYPKHQYHVSQCGEHGCSANNKMNRDYYKYQVCLISWMNIDCKENGGKKAFFPNPQYLYHVSQCGELDCCTNNKKNGDYHVHPRLSHFMDEL